MRHTAFKLLLDTMQFTQVRLLAQLDCVCLDYDAFGKELIIDEKKDFARLFIAQPLSTEKVGNELKTGLRDDYLPTASCHTF